MSVLEDAEKPVNNVEDKSLSVDEEKLATGTYCVLSARDWGVSAYCCFIPPLWERLIFFWGGESVHSQY